MYDSQAVMVDQTLYISGIIGLDAKTLTLVSGGVEAEAEQVLFLCVDSFVYVLMAYYYMIFYEFLSLMLW